MFWGQSFLRIVVFFCCLILFAWFIFHVVSSNSVLFHRIIKQAACQIGFHPNWVSLVHYFLSKKEGFDTSCKIISSNTRRNSLYMTFRDRLSWDRCFWIQVLFKVLLKVHSAGQSQFFKLMFSDLKSHFNSLSHFFVSSKSKQLFINILCKHVVR